MCGIVGAISTRINQNGFNNAVESLYHRGPDGNGIYNHKNVWLGHTRLAINDLSELANQPFIDIETGYVIIFNGEIYNYRALREQLKNTGAFHTDCEAEVISRLYGEHGSEMCSLLDGMFSFVIYDPASHSLFGARDRFGKKPFFFHLNEGLGEVYWASELKVFKQFPISLALDTRVIDNILNFTHYYGESVLQGVRSLMAGCYFRIDLTKFIFKEEKYFCYTDFINEKEYISWKNKGFKATAQELKTHLDCAVNKRLMSDVPVAIIASGGLDSSLISVLANKHGEYNLLHVDSVEHSELSDALLLSNKLGVKLSTDHLDYNVFSKLIDETIKHWEYPLVHTNATGILLLSQLAKREGYKVLLGGEGADELFAGYPHHRQYLLAQKINRFFSFVPTKLAQVLIYIRGVNNGGGLDPSVQHLINAHDYQKFYDAYSFVKSKYERQALAMFATDLVEYLIPLLSRADRMTMASGVEMRLPFLDPEIVQMALNLPLKYKIKFNQQKRILRYLSKNLLPNSVQTKRKVGFTVDYAERYIEDNEFLLFPHLDKYIPSGIIISKLKEKKQFHKIMRLYSLEKICEDLL